MKYSRIDRQTNKIIFLFIIIVGLSIIYIGLNNLHWAWNILTFPIGVITAISGYKNFKRTNNIISDIEFKTDKVNLHYLNGNEREISNSVLRYSLLIKKYHQPIRSIELIEKKKVGLLRGKSIGTIDIKKWENSIEPIARHLIQNNFERKKWKFGWRVGDFLMIFAIVMGFSEGIVESYIGEIGLNMSQAIGDVGSIISEETDKIVDESNDTEDNYLNK